MLRGIDRYTNTCFSYIQTRDLWMELAELAQTIEGDTRDTLETLIDMAQKVLKNPTTTSSSSGTDPPR